MKLKEALKIAVSREDYERAAIIRDQILARGEDAEAYHLAPARSDIITSPDQILCNIRTRGRVKDVRTVRKRTRPMREMMSERHDAVMEELRRRLAQVEDISGEPVYMWEVVHVIDHRTYCEEFMVDGVCVLRIQHFDDRFFV